MMLKFSRLPACLLLVHLLSREISRGWNYNVGHKLCIFQQQKALLHDRVEKVRFTSLHQPGTQTQG